jgi:TAT-translocated FGD2 family F420-dependent dehydrogenase
MTAISGTTASSAKPFRAQPAALDQRNVGFMLGHEQFPVPELLQLGELAEASGFDLLATSDHLQPWQDNEGHSGLAWVTLAALGQRVSSGWMGTTVTCPTMRYHPAIIAEAFASLSLLSPGRIFLGVGSGEALNEQAATGDWPAWEIRWERLIEAVALIRKLWSGNYIYHHGKHFDVEAKLYDTPPQPIPIFVAANGPKAMRKAGRIADGLVTDPKTWKEHKHEFVAGLADAGKTLDGIPILIEQFVVVGDQRDAEQAARLWRFIPEAFTGHHNNPDPRDIQRQAVATMPLDKVYADWSVGTDPQTHIDAIRELFDSGATIVNIHSGQPDQKRVIEFYGEKVLTQLNRTTKH